MVTHTSITKAAGALFFGVALATEAIQVYTELWYKGCDFVGHAWNVFSGAKHVYT